MNGTQTPLRPSQLPLFVQPLFREDQWTAFLP
jgi:hypothetical protein